MSSLQWVIVQVALAVQSQQWRGETIKQELQTLRTRSPHLRAGAAVCARCFCRAAARYGLLFICRLTVASGRWLLQWYPPCV